MSNGNETKTSTRGRRARFVEDHLLSIGYLFDGKLKLIEQLGQGKFGKVYSATHTILDQKKVVKVLEVPGTYDEEPKERFIREAQIAASLIHENIVPIHDAGISKEGYPYLVMPFLEGETLQQWIERTPLEQRDYTLIKQYLSDVCEGLSLAHEKNVVHRDIKPGNIFLSTTASLERPTAVILDFGVARNTMEMENTRLSLPGQSFGTEGYMSPEQARGEDPGSATDIYSVGAILYELLTDVKPNPYKKNDPPRKINPDVPVDLHRACLRAIEPLPKNRYQTADEMADDLNYQAPDEWRTETSSPNWGVWIAVVVGILLVFNTGVWILFGGSKVTSQKENIVTHKDTISTSGSNVTSKSRDQIALPIPEKHTQSPNPENISPVSKTPSTAEIPVSKSSPAQPTVKKEEESKPEVSSSEIIEQTSTTYSEFMKQAREHLERTNYIDAEFAYQEAIRVKPSSGEAWFGMAVVAKEQRRYKVAADRIQTALKQKNNGNWRIELGKMLWAQGKKQDAEKEWSTVASNTAFSESTRDKARKCLESYN
ncbi:MAG: protein kinase [Deltaproteobacteria bacterium]|nr:protein kinase [Deltaproteobacteria bacterium]